MRVVFFSHSTSMYGANRSLLNLIEGLVAFNVAVDVIVPAEGNFTNALTERGLSFHVVRQSHWFHSEEDQLKGIKGDYVAYEGGLQITTEKKAELNHLVNLLHRLQPDVVYSNSVVIQEGAIAAHLTNRPHIWHLREYGDLDYGRSPLSGWEQARAFITTSVATISVSESVQAHHLDTHDPEKDFVIYNGVATADEFDELRYERQKRNAARESKCPFTFALVGKILPAKGQETAIRALARLISDGYHVQLLIAGDGESDHLKALVNQARIDRFVEFRGFVRDPFSLFLEADAALMCSANEAFGRVTVEAMATGLPVIGNGTGGTKEIIRHETNGLIYQGGDGALAECMWRLVDNPIWADQLGMSAWTEARDKYCIETYSKQVWDVIRQVRKNVHITNSAHGI